MNIERLPDGRYAIDGKYFKSLDAYFTCIEALREEYEIDKRLYEQTITGEWNERR